MTKAQILKDVKAMADVVTSGLVELRMIQEGFHNTLDKTIANNVQLLRRLEDLEKEME